jgi:hypothetical protein
MLGIAGDGGIFVLPASAACVQVLSCRAELSRGLDDEVTASSPISFIIGKEGGGHGQMNPHLRLSL